MEDFQENSEPELTEVAGDETAYLLRSPANAKRLLSAMKRLDEGGGTVMTLEELRASVSLDPSELRNHQAVRDFSASRLEIRLSEAKDCCICSSRCMIAW